MIARKSTEHPPGGYRRDPLWPRIQEYLPECVRLECDNLPTEEFVRVGEFLIHMDIYRAQTPCKQASSPEGQAQAPRGRIFLLHGVGGNGRLLSFLAVPFFRAGYEVICPDMPLYGYTEYSAVPTYDSWIVCIAAVIDRYGADDVPTFLFGLSAGGMLAYETGCRCSGVAGVLASCLLDLGDPTISCEVASSPGFVKLSLKRETFLRRLAGNIRIPMRWVCNMKAIANDASLAELLMADPKSAGAKVPVSFALSLLDHHAQIEPEDFTGCPVLLVHPGDDRWTDLRLSRNFYDRLACAKELVVLDGGGHFPVEQTALGQMIDASLKFMEEHSRCQKE
ncbi:alpha/beta hydrolase [Curtanaerobium respiraculi]|uniref:alpha/beta hydrolase n=1 Tax=Curtanaerobium respiraculi TaxID=2949669 RepID=UPI0024B3B54A|nr:alpha/beta hydrolase [Curtanaerobium respiraculi]